MNKTLIMRLNFTFVFSAFFLCTALFGQNNEIPQFLQDNAEEYSYLLDIMTKDAEVVSSRNDCISYTDSIINRDYVDEEWIDDRRDIFVYDEDLRLIEETNERIYDATVGLEFQARREYNYSGNIRTIFTYLRDLDTGELNLFRRETETFIDDDRVSMRESELYNAEENSWTNEALREFEYSEDDNLTLSVFSIWDAETESYEISSRRIFTYNETDVTLIESALTERTDDETGEYYFFSEFTYTYDDDLRLSVFEFIRIDADREPYLFLSEQYTYYPDGESFYLNAYVDFTQGLEGVNLEDSIINIFENGLNTVDSFFTFPFFMPDDLVFNGVNVFEYDDDDRLLLNTRTAVTNLGNEIFVAQAERYYKECVSDLESPLVQNANCRLPNPLTNGQSLTCDFTENRAATVHLYDLTGRRVLTREMSANGVTYFRNLPPDGAYILTAEHENGILYREKIIVAGGR